MVSPRPIIIGADFVGSSSSCLILGDNIFYGHGVNDLFKSAIARNEGATVFAYHVMIPSGMASSNSTRT